MAMALPFDFLHFGGFVEQAEYNFYYNSKYYQWTLQSRFCSKVGAAFGEVQTIFWRRTDQQFDSQSIIILLRMMNEQGNQGLSESHHKNECEVYDDLSALLQIFKKLLASIEEMAFNHQKQIISELPHERLKLLGKSLQSLVRKYSLPSGLLTIEIRTYQRFICRIFETIALYQLKYQNNTSPEIAFMLNTLNELVGKIKENQDIHHFAKLIKSVKTVVDRFSQFQFGEFGEAFKKEGTPINLVGKRPNILEKMETKMIRLRNNYKTKYIEKEPERCESEEEDYEYDGLKSATVSEKKIHHLPFSHSIGNDLQKRFELYRGLELDFSSFKSSYFCAKSNPQDFYREYLQRNTIISRLMKTYNDDFSLFQKKKLGRNHRRINNNKNPAGFSIQKEPNGKDNSSKQSTEGQRYAEKDKVEKKIAVIHNQNFQEGKEGAEPNKTSYKMNNVYLTFGKKPIKNLKNARHYPNITPNILKNKQQIQNTYFNQSQCPKSNLTITQSIDFELSHLKVISNMKGSQRIKTSPDRQAQYQSCKQSQLKQVLKSLKEIEQFSIKPEKKKRYLELDCTSKKEISLNRVILTGSLNVKHVKLSKINQQRSKNILF